MSKDSDSVTHHRLADAREERVSDMLSRKLVVGKNEMLGFVYLKMGCIVPAHKHISEQITFVLKGFNGIYDAGEKDSRKQGRVAVDSSQRRTCSSRP